LLCVAGQPSVATRLDTLTENTSKMKIKSSIRSVTLAGAAALLMAGGLSAANITYNTNGASTGFNGTSNLTLSSVSGAAATLVFTPNGNSVVSTPGNVNYGSFKLTCGTCTNSPGTSATFANFTFNLMISDITDGATGIFAGTGTGDIIYKDNSAINIAWSPLTLGPGSAGNSNGGSFGNTIFGITPRSLIVSPDSGTTPGVTSVQGDVSSTTTPEPATFALIGSGLIAVAFARRKKSLLQ
jgi:hypothetical protein